MQNINPNRNENQKPENSEENKEKLHRKIKETWPSLSDDDVKLYEENREDFFTMMKEKANISKEDALTKLQQLEKDSGCSSAKAA